MSGHLDSPTELGPTAYDDELSVVGPAQIDAFDQMQRLPGLYISRVVEQVRFIPGGQEWERQVQIRIPVPRARGTEVDTKLYVVSLGRFERRRFPDFSVVQHSGARCQLLSRRQHGHCLAIGLLHPFFTDAEFEAMACDDALRNQLDRLRIYLAQMVTTMKPRSSYTPGGARVLFDALMVNLNINLRRAIAASDVFFHKCSAALVGTQYLCWAEAEPGGTVNLIATYTQADIPITTDEGDLPRSPLTNPLSRGLRHLYYRARLWWRNRRTGLYVRYSLFPVRYNFPTPAYEHCGSYYFTITPPPVTQLTFLDWERGSRFQREPRGLFGRWHRRIALTLPSDGVQHELDCSTYAYHFHNRRLPGRSNNCSKNRRRSRRATGVTLRVFFRTEPADNGNLVALGFLSLGLALLAAMGALYSNGNSGVTQWLLLAPAVLTLFVGQQRQHHYAQLMRPFRSLMWLYIVFAMLFAATAVFGFSDTPLSPGVEHILLRLLSGVFVVASVAMIIAFAWSGEHFHRIVQRRYYRVMRRVRIFGTPSFTTTLRRYRWRRQYWRTPQAPLADDKILADRRGDHPSYRVFASVARHAIDRVLIGTAFLLAAIVTLMLTMHWGDKETCALEKLQAARIAHETGHTPSPGRCMNGTWTSRRQK